MVRSEKRKFECVNTYCVLCKSSSSELFSKGMDFQYRTSEKEFSFVKCTECGHVYLNPRPSDSTIHLAYPSDYYTLSGRHTESSSKIISSFKSFVVNRRLKFFKKILLSEASILEVGCGDGSLLMDLKRFNPSLDLHGIDMALPEGVSESCSSYGINVKEVSVENACLGNGKYNLVIMNQVIEHVSDPVSVMKKIAVSLKKGGFISIETPDVCGYDRRFFSRSFWGGYYFPRHLHLFSRKTAKRLVEQAGLSTVSQTSLLAPVIWIFSVHASLFYGPLKKFRNSFLSGMISDRNRVLLGLFTIVDIIAGFSGFETSNQKIIAMKND